MGRFLVLISFSSFGLLKSGTGQSSLSAMTVKSKCNSRGVVESDGKIPLLGVSGEFFALA